MRFKSILSDLQDKKICIHRVTLFLLSTCCTIVVITKVYQLHINDTSDIYANVHTKTFEILPSLYLCMDLCRSLCSLGASLATLYNSLASLYGI